jgi:hypothetical protein
MEGIVDRYAYALLTLAHAEGAAKLNLVTETVFCDQILKLLYYLTGALDMAGATDTNCDLYHNHFPLSIHILKVFGGLGTFFLKKVPSGVRGKVP